MWEAENGKKRKLMCWEFGLGNSMIQTICKKRAKIINVFEWNGSTIKSFWKPEWSDVSEALFKWFLATEKWQWTSGWYSSHDKFYSS